MFGIGVSFALFIIVCLLVEIAEKMGVDGITWKYLPAVLSQLIILVSILCHFGLKRLVRKEGDRILYKIRNPTEKA